MLLPSRLRRRSLNLGTAAITAMLGAAIFFAAGVRWWKFLLVMLPAPLLANFGYAHLHDYHQRARIDTFLNPESDPLVPATHHSVEDRAGLRRLVGQGLSAGHPGHLDFLPEKQTDFIFTMIGEEFGLVGGLTVMTLLCPDHPGRHADRTALPQSVRSLVALGICLELFPVCLRQYRHGDGCHAGGWGAAAVGLPRRLGDADGHGRLWCPDVGACAP